MRHLEYTLLAEGSSDRALMPILTWAVRQRLHETTVHGNPADLRALRRAPRLLHERMRKAVELWPCALLFVHRDSDSPSSQARKSEIEKAYAESGLSHQYVSVVPIRMTEAWLLLDEGAIRKAAGNPHGKDRLDLPRAPDQISNPKEILVELLVRASGLSGRRRKDFRPERRVWQIPGCMKDLRILRRLSAFKDFEEDLSHALDIVF